MRAVRTSLAQALASVPSGSRLGVGGVLLNRKPLGFLAALVAAGRRDLRYYGFLGSLDVELLAAADALAEVHAGYVGLEQLGFAPAYQAGQAAGRLRRVEYSEFMFVGGLRAALAGLPFMPVLGGVGSDLVGELGLAEVTCPYTGTPVLTVPAIRPDVTVLHAEAADDAGNVLGPADPDFLYDLDANLARASRRAVVTVERVVSRSEVVAANSRTLLFGFEVDAVVVLPGGARPGALPGSYPADLAGIADYLAAVEREPTTALSTLVAQTGQPTTAAPVGPVSR